MMQITLVTDAWYPQVNGVVRTWSHVKKECEAMGHTFKVIAPDSFRTVPCPSYPEIRLALVTAGRIGRVLDDVCPDALHIATEGPLGWAARRHALRRGWPFTTSFHTRFPEYLEARLPFFPIAWSYSMVRRFHRPSQAVLVATPTMKRELASRGFTALRDWTRGVDTSLFRPGLTPALVLPKPVFLYVGRVAIEKNIEAFLRLELPGSKLVVGGGPQLADLARRYPDVHFAGERHGEALAAHYASGDVLVFPSLTDTFGLVMLEAMATGIPVAAFPVPGPLDVVDGHGVGVLDDDLSRAALAALNIDGAHCRAHAERQSWRACAEMLIDALAPIKASATAGARRTAGAQA